jgi:hypothetical protein
MQKAKVSLLFFGLGYPVKFIIDVARPCNKWGIFGVSLREDT